MKITPFWWALVGGLFALGSALSVSIPLQILADAPVPSAIMPTPEVPIGSKLVALGEENFAMSCSQCHGDDAHGDEGSDLHNLTISNARIIHVVKKGIKGEMPPFEKKYNDQQIAALVSYLRTLN